MAVSYTHLYRVADVSESGEFTLAGDFVDYPISLENLDNAGWRALAQTLAGYVARDHLGPYKTAKTDENGRAFFDHLPTGLYLVMGDSYEKGRTTYTPDPFARCLPNPDGETGEWMYDVEASCKYDSEYDLSLIHICSWCSRRKICCGSCRRSPSPRRSSTRASPFCKKPFQTYNNIEKPPKGVYGGIDR